MWSDVIPVPKPRQTRSDVWKKRPIVMRYRQFADDLREDCRKKGFVPSGWLVIVFHLPMPKSWSKKKKEGMLNMSHCSKPDLDNLVKSCVDALFAGIPDRDDACVHTINARKVWSTSGGMFLRNGEELVVAI